MFSNLKYDHRNVLVWFKVKSIKGNSGKFQLMVLGLNKIASFRLNINSKIIPCSNAVKLLEILIRNKFKFKEHIEKLCKKASFDFHALRRIGG